ncbi:hypothetical protein [uncultured Pseudonocardia sp.]|jgi:hypothetical protein|uniref:hypothetical protein n=1 Tax=uncultured Pseudonocardia sp. TaxID=211455 RepID=UPI0026047E01|nr:hypothetical protein [uncultured Pseudonocardia sp.]
MTSAGEQPEFLFKDPSSITGNCPASYRMSRNGRSGMLVQGPQVSPELLAQLRDRGADETGVWIPDDLGRLIAKYYTDQG